MTVMVKVVGPVLRTWSANAKGCEAWGNHGVRDASLEEALSRLARIVPHLRFLAALLQTFLGRVADVVALVDVVHVSRVVVHLQDEVLRVLLRYEGGGWQEFFAGDHLEAWRLATPVPDVRPRGRDRAGG